MHSATSQLAIIAILAFSVGGSVLAQPQAKTELADESMRIAPLKGKPTVAMVASVTAEIEDVGVATNALNARIREYLQANSIPYATALPKADGILWVTVFGQRLFQQKGGIAGSGVEPAGVVVYLRLEYREWAQQIRMPKQEKAMSLWDTDDFFKVGEQLAKDAVLSTVMGKVKDFATDYLRANPDLAKH